MEISLQILIKQLWQKLLEKKSSSLVVSMEKPSKSLTNCNKLDKANLRRELIFKIQNVEGEKINVSIAWLHGNLRSNFYIFLVFIRFW